MAGGVEFLGRLENRLRAEGCPGIVAGERGVRADSGFQIRNGLPILPLHTTFAAVSNLLDIRIETVC